MTTAAGGIVVVSLVTAVTRSWTLPAADGSAASLSWAGDRYVAFAFSARSGDRDAGGVRVLDTRSAATAALRGPAATSPRSPSSARGPVGSRPC